MCAGLTTDFGPTGTILHIGLKLSLYLLVQAFLRVFAHILCFR
ncbi:Uncharacterised protein [Mycobacteroides abscessus subsp. abscessus]|nr:Uncharacterised protein [Mycobacteroides abscessus subsp. abscessus]